MNDEPNVIDMLNLLESTTAEAMDGAKGEELRGMGINVEKEMERLREQLEVVRAKVADGVHREVVRMVDEVHEKGEDPKDWGVRK